MQPSWSITCLHLHDVYRWNGPQKHAFRIENNAAEKRVGLISAIRDSNNTTSLEQKAAIDSPPFVARCLFVIVCRCGSSVHSVIAWWLFIVVRGLGASDILPVITWDLFVIAIKIVVGVLINNDVVLVNNDVVLVNSDVVLVVVVVVVVLVVVVLVVVVGTIEVVVIFASRNGHRVVILYGVVILVVASHGVVVLVVVLIDIKIVIVKEFNARNLVQVALAVASVTNAALAPFTSVTSFTFLTSLSAATFDVLSTRTEDILRQRERRSYYLALVRSVRASVPLIQSRIHLPRCGSKTEVQVY